MRFTDGPRLGRETAWRCWNALRQDEQGAAPSTSWVVMVTCPTEPMDPPALPPTLLTGVGLTAEESQ